jgi:dTDP-4-dehydrorhamnose 3,5-epimerase-like enzyme
MSSVQIKKLRVVQDARGQLFEPVDVTEMLAQKNVHVVISEPMVIRGNHRHIKGSEIAAVQGPCRALFEEKGEVTEYLVPVQEVWQFSIPAGVAHAYQNIGTHPTVLIGFNSELHDPNQPDTERVNLMS